MLGRNADFCDPHMETLLRALSNNTAEQKGSEADQDQRRGLGMVSAAVANTPSRVRPKGKRP